MRLMVTLLSLLLALFPEEFGYGMESESRTSVYPINRMRRKVTDIFGELGPLYGNKRAYRMSGE